MKRAVVVGMGLVLVGGVVTPGATTAARDTASAAVMGAAMPFDFDGDGFADLAVGVIRERLRGKRDAGAVQVLYGSESGPTARDQLWHQGRKGVKGALEKGDRFGWSLASGDFDTDGYADLAIGVPEENVGKEKDAGVVQVLYGSPSGLTASGDQVWHQGKKGVPGTNEGGDGFGESLAVGDFDADGYADLVVGVPGEDVGEKTNAGRVVMLRGSAAGLTSVGAQLWGENSAGVASKPGSHEQFGHVLAAGDVNGDGHDDLTIGIRYDGGVHLLLGSTSGLTASGSQHFLFAGTGFRYLTSLWLGDVNADGHDDLALGGHQEVAVLHGHADGLHPGPLAAPGQPGTDALWSGVSGPAVSGDLTGDGFADLAMVSSATASSVTMSIAVGTANGLGSDQAAWSIDAVQNSAALSILPFSGGTHGWLAVGLHVSPVGGVQSAGTVTVLQGNADGTPGPATVWSQDSPGIKGTAERPDMFGSNVGGPDRL
jgi:hypothetical protein